MRIMAVDPGTTTGLTYWTPIAGYMHQHLGPDEHHHELLSIIESFQPEYLVWEAFTFRPNPGRKMVVLDSREYIGICKLYVQRALYEVKWAEQQPSQAKNFWTDDKIKKLGLWQPSMKHAMDALRHLLYYRVFKLGHKDILTHLKK